MKKLSAKIAALTISAAVCCSFSGCVFLPDEETILAAPSVEQADVSYSTITAKKRDIVDQDINTGIIASQTQYNLSFKEQSGTISKIYVHAGDKVKKGDIICELDTSDLAYSIKETELKLRSAQLDKQILQEGGASQAEIDRAQVEVDLVQMQLDTLYEQRDSAKLYSAIDGTVSALGMGVSAGNYVNQGDTVATVIDTNSLYVAIQPETDNYKLYKIGTKMSIRIDGELYDAEVFMTPDEVVASDFEEEEVIYEVYDPDAKEDAPDEMQFDREHVYVKFTGTPPEDCVGALADTILVLDERKDVVVISNNLIKSIDDKNIVYLYKDGKKVAQEVEVGLQTGSLSEIVSGVEEGDTVIVR